MPPHNFYFITILKRFSLNSAKKLIKLDWQMKRRRRASWGNISSFSVFFTTHYWSLCFISDVVFIDKSIEEKQNENWNLLNKLEAPIRDSHKSQTLKALLKIRAINLTRDPMAIVFQVLLPVTFAALGIYMGTLSSGKTKETKQLFNLGTHSNAASHSSHLSICLFINSVAEKYRTELNSNPFLHSEGGNVSMANFWQDFADFNSLKISNYSGEFSDIVDFLDQVCSTIFGQRKNFTWKVTSW